MRIVFMGTPDFAVPSLIALIKYHDVVGVVCQPDRKGDRNKVVISKVKEIAIQNNIPVYQFERISQQGQVLKDLNADIFVTCAYGQILSKEIIDMCKFGIINVHASLLPKYRGAAPIQWSIINGEKRTGITIMQTAEGLDTGDILLTLETDIGENETAEELFERLSILGSKALIQTLDKIQEGSISYTKQNDAEASYVKMLKKSDGLINWDKNAKDIHNLVRGLYPWPCAYTFLNDKFFKILSGQAEIVKNRRLYRPGEVIECDFKNGLLIACQNGTAYRVNVLQPQNSKQMQSVDYLKGHSIDVGSIFGSDK